MKKSGTKVLKDREGRTGDEAVRCAMYLTTTLALAV
jgi:hypothetical protein